jgi:NodT family efflux transporter outer membrane factor (OMF) lipoprotein
MGAAQRSGVVARWALLVMASSAVAAGCMVGPGYRRPAAPTQAGWIEEGDARVAAETPELVRWWGVFADPTLDELVSAAYAQNSDLRAAGLRVLAAQARRGIAIGGVFPQTQAVSAAYTRTRVSANTPTSAVTGRDFDSFQAGLDAAWELDLWGRFRRAIEAADADLLAAVASYDDVLVSLVAEVATTYVGVRVLEERLRLAEANVRVQREGLEIARVRFEAGGTSELDLQQATTLLAATQAAIPALHLQRRQAEDSLAVLLGVPPAAMVGTLDDSRGIPVAPPTVAVDVPAALVERRPDVRRAEHALAAQSARIGVAVADLLPRVQLTGTVGLSADEAARFFEGRSFAAMAGPRFDWPVLNYGRLVNAVRVEDATFEELAATYQRTILQAEREVEDALVGYLRGMDRVAALGRSVEAADRAVDLSLIQYREGAADYTRVLQTQQAKLQEDDALASARGDVSLNVIGLYRALGGGWELRDGADAVPETTRVAMRARGWWWGGALDPARRAGEIQQAAADTAADRPWWRPRWWWPRW